MVSVASGAVLLFIRLRLVWKYGGPSMLNTYNKGGNSFIPTDTPFNVGSALMPLQVPIKNLNSLGNLVALLLTWVIRLVVE